MPDFELVLNIDSLFTINLNCDLSQPGVTDILNSIQELGNTIMTQLDTSAAKEAQDTDALIAAVQAMAAAIEQLRSGNNADLQAALDAVNLDAAQQAAILDANDSAVEAALAQANAALNPTPQDTQPAGNGGDTLAGGGTDTTGGGSGSDAVVVEE